MLIATVRDERACINGRGIGHQQAQFVIAQEYHILWVIDKSCCGKLFANRDQHEAQACVRALVDVKVMIGRQRIHAQRQIQRSLQFLASLTRRDIVQ